MNLGSADAGIWAPYKANLSIVVARTRGSPADGPQQLLRANVAHVDTDSEARDATCRLGTRVNCPIV